MRAKIRGAATDEAQAADKLYEKKPHLRPKKADDGRRIGQWTAKIVDFASTRAGRRLAAVVARRK